MKSGSIARKVSALIMLAQVLCLTGCMTSKPVKLSSWKDFRKEMLNKYDCIRRLEGKQYDPWLNINVYYGGDKLLEDDREEILDDFHTFLSGDKFLGEYIPYGQSIVPDAAVYIDPPMPDINIRIMRYGSDASEYTSEAWYYTENYDATKKMTVDCYQTWYEWDRTAEEEE